MTDEQLHQEIKRRFHRGWFSSSQIRDLDFRPKQRLIALNRKGLVDASMSTPQSGAIAWRANYSDND